MQLLQDLLWSLLWTNPQIEMSLTIDGGEYSSHLSPTASLSRFGSSKTRYYLLMLNFMQVFPTTNGLL